MKIKWCVVGAGGIADRRTIPAILSDENNELVAVMDKVPDTAKIIGDKYGVKFYTDIDEMLSDNACDAVYIGTPVAIHYEQALTCLKYGVNVFMEKPITVDAESGKELVNKFKEQGKLLFIGYMMKYHNLHQKAKRLIKQGGIGQVVNARLQFSCWYPEIAGAWRQKKALGGGGAVMDLAVHCIELIEFILGEEIEEVKSFCERQSFSYEVEDSGIIIFKTKSGTLGHIDVNFNIPDVCSESKLEIYGTKGYIICKGTLGQEEVGKMEYLYAPQGDYEAQQSRVVLKPKKYSGKKGNIYLKQIQDFCNLLQKGKLDYKYANRAVQVQEVVDKIYTK